MPEFQLNAWGGKVGHKRPFDTLDTFAQGYVEAMFFTNGDTGDDNEFRLNELGVHKLTKAAVRDIKEACDTFLGKIGPDGCFMRQWLDRYDEYSDEQAGRDLWFTRQGHGVGFGDRDALDDQAKAVFREMAHAMGEAEVYVKHGGWIEHVG